jgi:hypothetical protein
MDDSDWKKLLRRMREGNVVPVVGSRLLLDADNTTSLYAKVARKVLHANRKALEANREALAKKGIDVDAPVLPPFRELNAAVTLLTSVLPPAKAQDLYGDIDEALKELADEGLQVPEPLKQLAQITDFRLMVTLTPDDLLARALRDAHRDVNEVVHAPKLSTSDGSDIGDVKRPGGPVQLLYLFGKSAPTPLFAIHDEDILEYAHNIMAHGSHAPDNFLGALRARDLLLIGCNFPDWLSRFVLRTTRENRLTEQGGKQWLVERFGKEDTPFIGFLGAYSPYTEVLGDQDPAQFVDALRKRWTPPEPAASVPSAGGTEATRSAIPGADEREQNVLFFISYSRNDLASAEKLFKTLVELGVKPNQIWFDKEQLEPGAPYENDILEGIRNCRHFLPLVSRAAVEREEGFVFKEWLEATDRLTKINRDDYLVPVIVDADYQPGSYRRPKNSLATWHGVNYSHAPGGDPVKDTRDFLAKKVRESRSRGR